MWNKFIVNEAEIWKAFHNFWIERLGILPIMIVRYEDLLRDETVSELIVLLVKYDNLISRRDV
jgi:hypothetical protein